jgi:hypothetical protein
MTLEDLGYNQEVEEYQKEHNRGSFGNRIVILEYKNSYTIKTAE